MGLTDWALKGRFKKLRESETGQLLSRGFANSGYNDGTPAALKRAEELYEEFYLTVSNHHIARQDAQAFARDTVGSRYPILFNVALDHGLNFYSREELLEVYRDDKAQVIDLAAYVDAIYPEFIHSRPRTAGSLKDVHVFEVQMSFLVIGAVTYMKNRRA